VAAWGRGLPHTPPRAPPSLLALTPPSVSTLAVHQELAQQSVGSPPVLISKVAEVPFVAGAPIELWGPELEGYQRYPGRSLFTAGAYECAGSLRWAGGGGGGVAGLTPAGWAGRVGELHVLRLR
jgi:hypothetical protein